jgi:enoyl-CoA hydratase/carnithine racemase
MFETLAVETAAPHVLLLRLNRPAASNALNTQMGRDLLAFFQHVPEGTRAIVLTGAGERAFCAGGDLKERNGMTDAQWQAQHEVFERAYWALMDCPLPIIAAVNGAAFGGGCEMALACDFAYAAETARFALTEVTLGIMPGAGGTQNLPRAAGSRRAKEIIFTGLPFSAAEALEWGVVNRVLPAAELLPAALATAARIAANAPLAIRQAKTSIRFGAETDLHSALRLEVEAYNRLVPTEDRREGVAAFNEKRAPRFQGR